MNTVDPADWSALLALQRATHLTLHTLAVELAELDLTPAELNVLANLADGRDRTAGELAADTGSKPTTLTSVLDRLERRGHIGRGPRPGNRRSVVITLTDSGRATAAVVRRAVADLEHRALAGLDATALAGLRAGLRALSEPPS